MTDRNQADILIRKIQPHESALYRKIRLAGLKNAPDNFGSTHEEETNKPKLSFEAFIEKGGDEQFVFGAFDNGKLIGIAGFARMERQKERHRGEVVHMYVEAKYRGQNIGEKLLRGLVEQAFSLEGIEQIQLSVIAGNRAAVKLYEKVGFKVFGLQPQYFKMGDRYTDQQFMWLFKSKYLGLSRFVLPLI